METVKRENSWRVSFAFALWRRPDRVLTASLTVKGGGKKKDIEVFLLSTVYGHICERAMAARRESETERK